ncbi:hypothetical protein ACFL0V_01860 [Nanoarchaeota archaeon]
MINQFALWLQYFFTLIVVFLGIYVGALLAYLSPEELKGGKKYFRGMMHTLVAIAIGLLVFHFGPVVLAIAIGILVIFMLYMLPDSAPVDQILYILMGFVFLASTRSQDLFIAIAAIIFLIGLPLGSRYVERHPKKSKDTVAADILLIYGGFLVIALISYIGYLYMMR